LIESEARSLQSQKTVLHKLQREVASEHARLQRAQISASDKDSSRREIFETMKDNIAAQTAQLDLERTHLDAEKEKLDIASRQLLAQQHQMKLEHAKILEQAKLSEIRAEAIRREAYALERRLLSVESDQARQTVAQQRTQVRLS